MEKNVENEIESKKKRKNGTGKTYDKRWLPSNLKLMNGAHTSE
ncbi:hypothetical protein DOY81_005952 [Sarcophaga bullata]|nr:hypothetical protein DOY81_005952 [Sarcophaga bullata]